MSKLLLVALDASEAEAGAGFAQSFGLPYDFLILTGSGATEFGAEKVLLTGWTDAPPADALATGLERLAKGYSHIASVSSMHAKDVLARLAGLLDAGMLTDILAFESHTRFKRPIFAGAVIATVDALTPTVVLTIRPAGFPQAKHGGASPVESVSIDASSKVNRLRVSQRGTGRPDLTQAKVIVSGGRPLRDAATYESVIGGLADALGGAAGATRAAVDSGIAPNELQVGQTGKIVAPDLYIAAGISGSTQHMAGIKDSKLIVAINKDSGAPIFEFADLGLVADLYDAIPEIRSKIGK